MRLAHLCLVARDADLIAEFYRSAFGFSDMGPAKRLSGERVSRGAGLPDAQILSIRLALPGTDGPYLEIHQYSSTVERGRPPVNATGYGHMALVVDDIHAAIGRVMQSGGMMQGEPVDLGTAEAPSLAVYMRDPEGNLVELEQQGARGLHGNVQPS